MSVETSREKQDLLLSYLREMAKDILNKQELQNMLAKLEVLYSEKFRHSYSEFFNLILDLGKDESGYDLTYLATNLMELTALLDSTMESKPNSKRKSFSKSLAKLSDHINLEIGRWNYYQSRDEKIQLTEMKIIALNKETSEASKETKKLKRQLDNSQKEYISILGIFSSVVLTFTAGIAFSTSVLENIHQASVYRLVLGVLLIAFVLINVIFLLFHYVDKMVHGEDTKGLAFIKWIDLAMVIAMVIVVASWFFGVVEWRNGHYNDEPATPTIANMTEEQLEKKIEEILNETMKNNVDVDITISGELQESQSQEIPVTGE